MEEGNNRIRTLFYIRKSEASDGRGEWAQQLSQNTGKSLYSVLKGPGAEER